MSTDVAVQTAQYFFKEMGQEFKMPHEYMYTRDKLEGFNDELLKQAQSEKQE